MFSIKIDKNIIKNVTEIDINLLIPHEKVLVDKKEILKNNLKYKDDYIIISSIIINQLIIYMIIYPLLKKKLIGIYY